MFGYGIYLQLLDDIQDIKEDLSANSRTMFSCNGKRYIDEFVNQTIHFGRTALEELKCFDKPLTSEFLELMNQSIETMIIESMGLNPDSYSLKWLNQIEKHSPLHFEFIRQKKAQSKSQRYAIFRKYFDQAKPEMIKV